MPTIFSNGRFLRPSPPNPQEPEFAECLMIDDESGRILHVGAVSDPLIQEELARGGQTRDMEGRVVVPGLIDPHMHLLDMGESLQKLDLFSCKNLEEIRSAIRTYAKAHPEMPRILCCSWLNSSSMDREALASDLDDLDARPIYISANDMHSAWCNRAALDELNADDLRDPPGGKIHRDANGKPSGILAESAFLSLALAFLAKQVTREQQLAFIHNGFQAYIQSGYTGLVDMAMQESWWECILEYRASQGGKLPIWMAVHWFILPQETKEETMKLVDRAIELRKTFNATSSPDLRIAGIKIMCDGVVDSCTASLREPYSHTNQNADAVWTTKDLVPVLKRADDAGLQVAIHAIGDAAIGTAIDSLEQVGNPAGRHRIEHLEMCSPDDVKRLGKLGITASVQPVHSDPAILEAWPKLIGPQRCEHIFPYGGLAEHGAHIAIGTDAPTALHHPLPNLYNATTRRSARDPENTKQTAPRFALSLAAAMAGASQGAAYSCFADNEVGRLEKGKLANLTIIDMEWIPEKLLEGKVVETWYHGKRIFQAV